MTAENGAAAGGSGRIRTRFNEAAADDRGKHHPGNGRIRGPDAASMRPRPMTAENFSSCCRSSVISTLQ